MTKKRNIAMSLILSMGMIISTMLVGALAADPVYTKRGSNSAAGGYDVVAYFTQSAAVKGNAEFVTNYNGAEWSFSSAENLASFKSNPTNYAPQYGGYCAWALAQGKLAAGKPKFWTIEGGKLYLNYSKGIQKKWLKDMPGFIAKADANWPAILDE
ncbi:MAG: YHS domain-containing (seleno)protein [Parvularculaceae bacterium]